MQKFSFVPVVPADKNKKFCWDIRPIQNTVEVLEQAGNVVFQERRFVSPYSGQELWRWEVVKDGELLGHNNDYLKQKKAFDNLKK